MTIVFLILLAVAIVSFIAISLITYKKKTSDPMPQLIVEEYTVTAFDIEVVRVINEHKINLDLNALPILQVLCDVAATHSKYMAEKNEESHDFATVRQQYFKPKNIGEIVGYGYIQPLSYLAAWVNSPSHYKAIKNNKYKNIGIATAVGSNGKKYVTVLFMD